MTTRFIYDLPMDTDYTQGIEVVFNPEEHRVVAATYEHDGSPVKGRTMSHLRAHLSEAIFMAKGWRRFIKQLKREVAA